MDAESVSVDPSEVRAYRPNIENPFAPSPVVLSVAHPVSVDTYAYGEIDSSPALFAIGSIRSDYATAIRSDVDVVGPDARRLGKIADWFTMIDEANHARTAEIEELRRE
ncbi:hypothetical protein [Nocardia xishanensis]